MRAILRWIPGRERDELLCDRRLSHLFICSFYAACLSRSARTTGSPAPARLDRGRRSQDCLYRSWQPWENCQRGDPVFPAGRPGRSSKAGGVTTTPSDLTDRAGLGSRIISRRSSSYLHWHGGGSNCFSASASLIRTRPDCSSTKPAVCQARSFLFTDSRVTPVR